jgi:hypothetical protein
MAIGNFKNRPRPLGNFRSGGSMRRPRANIRSGGNFLRDFGKAMTTAAVVGGATALGGAAGALGGPVTSAAGGAAAGAIGSAAAPGITHAIWGKGFRTGGTMEDPLEVTSSLPARLMGMGLAPRSLQPRLSRQSLRW